ncbi:MAG: NADH-quinone oxidoreductase subunit C [Geodermatophilaceae bacterium]|nr:NADH-quinone oxidoreductase subunit C [Geodermatophilaceae bacterium]
MSAGQAARRLADETGGRAEESFGLWCVHVAADRWVPALRTARDELGLTYLDWLGGVDEAGGAPEPGGVAAGFAVLAHLLHLEGREHLLVRTPLPSEHPRLSSAVEVFPGAGWHERETAEMYGIVFLGHPDPAALLLRPDFGAHPLRKDFLLTARVATPWPGSVDPTGKERRRAMPPGVPAAAPADATPLRRAAR